VHDSNHYDVDRIVVGLSRELHYWIMCSSDGGQPGDKRAHNSTTKVSFCTIIIRLCPWESFLGESFVFQGGGGLGVIGSFDKLQYSYGTAPRKENLVLCW